MIKFFFKKEHQLETLIYSYLENLENVHSHFVKGLNLCLEAGTCDDLDFLAKQTHKFESKADDVREEINQLMYSKALIPESREDIMGLLEAIDQIPRYFELVLNMIQMQKLVIPEFLVADIKELIRISIESCSLMIKQVDVMLKKKEGIRALLATIDQNESHCDHIERRMINKIFDSDLDPFQKLQLKEMVIVLGEISDQADRVSKRINIITMKRRV
jgi:predicted phosphate transport protein (TIGR00153 family)